MNDLMPHNSGELIGALGALDQSRENVDRATGHGKSIELIFIDGKKTIIERLGPGGSQNAPSYAIDIALDFRIIDEPKILFCLAAEFTADSCFLVFTRRTDGG
jgi:hypothetical protein